MDSVPSPQKMDLRYTVAWHQYRMIHTTTLLRQSFAMPGTASAAQRVDTAFTPIWYMSLRRKAIQQHPTDDTVRTQVNYKPKRWDQHAPGPKRKGQSPTLKSNKLAQRPITIDTANRHLRVLCHLPPQERRQLRERILSIGIGPPPGERIFAPSLGMGTPVHHA